MRVFGLLVCITGLASGQALIEHAVAAGGGSVAGVAGKKVSDGVDKILGKARSLVLASGQEPATPTAPKGQVSGLPAPFAPSAGTSMPLWKQAGTVASHQPEINTAAPDRPEALPSSPVAPAPNLPTVADISRIERGTTREQLAARLGAPSSRVFIPEDGTLLEIYSYRSADGQLSTIRLTDGTVTAVRPATGSH